MNTLSFISQAEGTILLKGEMTFSTVKAALGESVHHFDGDGDLRIDMRGVRRTDSAGLSLLIEWMRRLRGEQREIEFVNFPRQFEGLARVSGADEILAASMQ